MIITAATPKILVGSGRFRLHIANFEVVLR